MNKTKIEWVKNPDGSQGYTWNPITGCLEGCSYCYARKLANGRLRERYLINLDLASCPTPKKEHVNNPFYPRFWFDRLWTMGENHRRNASQQSKGYFVCDMSDLFGIGVPEQWTKDVLHMCRDCSEHRFYLLTKQPQNLRKFSPFPDNCWVGVSATDAESYYDAMSNLAGIEAKVKYISFEPLLGVINGGECTEEYRLDSIEEVDWVIIGSQTKPYKPPKIEWVKEIVDAANKVGVPVFLKNNLLPIYQKAIGDGTWVSEGYRLRQEMPS